MKIWGFLGIHFPFSSLTRVSCYTVNLFQFPSHWDPRHERAKRERADCFRRTVVILSSRYLSVRSFPVHHTSHPVSFRPVGAASGDETGVTWDGRALPLSFSPSGGVTEGRGPLARRYGEGIHYRLNYLDIHWG